MVKVHVSAPAERFFLSSAVSIARKLTLTPNNNNDNNNNNNFPSVFRIGQLFVVCCFRIINLHC